MKRRNVDCKHRRPVKRTKVADCFYTNILFYFKFVLMWGMVMAADYSLDFRFEFLWPFYVCIQSICDMYQFQGLLFTMIFVTFTLASDMICYFYIPVQFLFFAASIYVWVHYVWQSDRGPCLPTILLWIIFVYIEAAFRYGDTQKPSFHVKFGRPFAAHCLGYPLVIMGHIAKRVKNVKDREKEKMNVASVNNFIMELLQNALPIDRQSLCHISTPEKIKAVTASSDAVLPNGTAHNNGTHVKSSQRKSLDREEREKSCFDLVEPKTINNNKTYSHTNGSVHPEAEYIERRASVNHFDENEAEKDKSTKSYTQLKHNSKWNNHQVKENAANCQRERKNKANKENTENNTSQKDEYCQRLEADVKRLKIDLQASRQTEQELRCQVNALLISEKSVKSELCQLQLDKDSLQTKLQSTSSARQIDRQALTHLERRVQEERKLRSATKAQLANERKAKEAATRALSSPTTKVECTESCRVRRRDLEAEVKQLKREIKSKDDKCLAAERDIQCLKQYKENHNECEILMSALSAMQDKNALLENSLSAETRIKLDLFSALGEAKRLLEIRENVIRQQERELDALKAKMAQVLAVMPTESFGPAPSSNTSMMRLTDTPSPSSQSSLDPNASVYTPKSSHLASAAEA